MQDTNTKNAGQHSGEGASAAPPLLELPAVSRQGKSIANATVYDVGFCRTSEGEEGISIDMYLADSSPLRLETLCESIRTLKPLIEGKPHRITVRADSLHFRPLVGGVPGINVSKATTL